MSNCYNALGRKVRDSAGPESVRAYLCGHFIWPICRPCKSFSTATSRAKRWQSCETLPADIAGHNRPADLVDYPTVSLNYNEEPHR